MKVTDEACILHQTQLLSENNKIKLVNKSYVNNYINN